MERELGEANFRSSKLKIIKLLFPFSSYNLTFSIVFVYLIRVACAKHDIVMMFGRIVEKKLNFV